MRRVSWDIFISHASEDKDGFVRELADELRRIGVRVWYDGFTLGAGDSLRESIDRGIADSHIGVVVLSNNFFRKNWPRQELNGIFSLAVNEERRIIPVWLDISAKEVRHYSPLLADRVAILASKGVAAVRDEIRDAVWGEKTHGFNREVHIYQVEINGALRDLVALVPAELAFKHGLPEEAIVGVLRRPVGDGAHLADITPGNFVEHRFFGDFLHKFLAKEIYQSPTARKQARIQGSGYLYLLDGRAKDPQGSVPPEDVLGAIEVSDGDLIPGSYERNFNHQLFTWDGFFVLPEDLEHSLISTIHRLGAQRSERSPTTLSLGEELT